MSEWHSYSKPFDEKFRISDCIYNNSKSPDRILWWVLVYNFNFNCLSKFLYEFVLLSFDFHLFKCHTQ